ncbi:MAG: glycosyltransferase family 2 protein [Pedobacter sp.]
MQWSIIIPTYNYGHFIERCLHSVLNQIGTDYEIVIVDDGSSDDTRSVIDALAKNFPAERLRYFYQDNQGPAAARNHGIDVARGEFLWFLDSDDRLTGDAFEHMRLAVACHPDGELFFGGYRSVAKDGKTTDKLPGQLSSDNTVNLSRYLQKGLKSLTTGAVVVKKARLAEIRFPEGIHINEDVVFFGHLLARCKTVAVSQVVVEKIRHADSLRDNMTRIEETGLRSVDYLFDATRLLPEQMKLRSRYQADRCLRLFRSYFLNGDYDQARCYYGQALQSCPGYLFKIGYLLKFLRCIGR